MPSRMLPAGRQPALRCSRHHRGGGGARRPSAASSTCAASWQALPCRGRSVSCSISSWRPV